MASNPNSTKSNTAEYRHSPMCQHTIVQTEPYKSTLSTFYSTDTSPYKSPLSTVVQTHHPASHHCLCQYRHITLQVTPVNTNTDTPPYKSPLSTLVQTHHPACKSPLSTLVQTHHPTSHPCQHPACKSPLSTLVQTCHPTNHHSLHQYRHITLQVSILRLYKGTAHDIIMIMTTSEIQVSIMKDIVGTPV